MAQRIKRKSAVESEIICSLFPYEREEVFTIQEVTQQSGWHISAFNLPKAWAFTQGEGVVIGVIDTGCDTDHPDLASNLLPGWNFVNNNDNPIDGSGHGCVSPDCLIHTNYSGIQSIESLYDSIEKSEQVINRSEGSYLVKNVSDNDIYTYSFDAEKQETAIGKISSIQKLPIDSNIVVIELEGNVSYRLTPWHPVYLLKNKHHDVYKVIRKRADEVNLGDGFIFGSGPMCGKLGSECELTLPSIFVCSQCGHKPKYWINETPTKCKKCKNQEWLSSTRSFVVTEELAYLAGIVLTDGHVSKGRFEVYSETQEILEKVALISRNQGWTYAVESKRILVYGSDGVEKLVSMGVKLKNKSLSQNLPEWVGKSNQLFAFLAGVIDGDGCISKTNTKNRITTASQNLAYELACLLNALGISSSVSKEYDKRTHRKIKSQHPCYKVTHGPLTETIVYHLAHPKKIERSKIVPKYKRRYRRVKSIKLERYNGYFYDFTIEKYQNYIANGHFVSNTHVTGILVASNNQIGVVGVCPGAKVRPIKALDDKGNGNLKNVAAAVRWAADNGCDFIQLSLGAPVPVQHVREAIQYAASKGCIAFVAAGNAGDTKEVFYPAAYPECISIGAVDETLHRAKFSNTGKRLDFMAPGVNILSTVPDDWYAKLSGTSMAGPFACGVAALVKSYNNKIGGLKLNTAEDYRQLFRQHTTPVVNGNYTDPSFYNGFGIIDPRKFMESSANHELKMQSMAGETILPVV